MTQEPQQELEVQGRVGEPVVLPLPSGTDTGWTWTLELPEDVEEAGSRAPLEPDTDGHGGDLGRLRVRSGVAGSHVLTAVLAGPAGTAPMTVLLIRLTVS